MYSGPLILSIFFFSLISMTVRWGKWLSIIGLFIWLHSAMLWLYFLNDFDNQQIDEENRILIFLFMLFFILLSIIIATKNIVNFNNKDNDQNLIKIARSVVIISRVILLSCISMLIIAIAYFCF